MPVNSQQKHRRGHLEFARLCRQAGYAPAQCCRGALDCRALPGLYVEIRRTERLHLESAMAQAALTAGNRIPVVAHRTSRQPWRITMALDDFFTLYRGYCQRPLPGPESPKSAAYPGSDPDHSHRPAAASAP